MGRAKDLRAQRLAEETQRLLSESRCEMRQLDISEKEARENIRNFLDHLAQFDELSQQLHILDNIGSEVE